MNTLAKLYKHSLSLFYIAPASYQAESALIDLVSVFVANPKSTVVDIIQPQKTKESTQAFWQSLKDYDLCIRFIARKDGHALVVLRRLEPKPCPFADTKVIVRPIARVLVA